MVDIPNCTYDGGVLRSWGDGSNNSYWLPFTPFTNAVSNVSIAIGTTPVALGTALDVTVSGYTLYLAQFNFSGQNLDSGGSHDILTQIAYDGTRQGNFMQHTCASASGGAQTVSITNSFLITADDNLSHTISGYACISGASVVGNVVRANLVILGVS